jgi:hypothetical protein
MEKKLYDPSLFFGSKDLPKAGFSIVAFCFVEKSRQRCSLPSPERLHVYALERSDAQARRQVAIFPCSGVQPTLRAYQWLRSCHGEACYTPGWVGCQCRIFLTGPQPLMNHLILGTCAREHLHGSTFPFCLLTS